MTKAIDKNIRFLPGVGPKSAAKLEKLALKTILDLFFYYPRTYRDFTSPISIKNLPSRVTGEPVTVIAKVIEINNKKTSRRGFTVTEAIVDDGTGSIKVVCFNQPFLTKMIPVGREVILNGKIIYNFYSEEIVMESPERAIKTSIVPVYSETYGITSNYVNKIIKSVLSFRNEIPEYIPKEILKQYNLLGIQDALLNIHSPQNKDLLKQSQRRIAFDELFIIALRALVSKKETQKESAPPIDISWSYLAEFIKKLPFKLTIDQEKSISEIIYDLKKSTPMNRLLNGDVGSGKTIVAAVAALATIKAGFSVVLMAPTAILANQHYETFCKLFSKQPEIKIGLYTREKQEFSCQTIQKPSLVTRRQVLAANIIIGTQALIQKNIIIKNLGLVIVDEQHRFGVKQRGALLNMTRGLSTVLLPEERVKPHFLSMTATPIPRTLHLSLFGDLDISLIKQKPANRKEIKTRFVEPQNREKAYEFIRVHIKAGRQAFVICPLIESDPDNKLLTARNERKSVKSEYEKLQKIFPEYTIGMLHGRMSAKEKEAVMVGFLANKTKLLVSTSVVEVGVDVPNASIMIIEDAEHFGLAQLHQFRGRVGRAKHQSFCFLFSSVPSDKVSKRLKALEGTNDGFRLSEIDLQARGPGAVFGTEQSGMLDLKMADFSDLILIEKAASAAKLVIKKDPELKYQPVLKEKITNYLDNQHLE